MAVSKTSLKLLIDTKENRVLFAEAGNDFVDFLFSILSLPVGTITRLLTKESMVGSLGNLYKSIEDLNEKYIQPNQHKDTFLKPKLPPSAPPVPLLSLDSPPAATAAARSFYKCGNPSSSGGNLTPAFGASPWSHGGSSCSLYVAVDPSAVCPNCKRQMTSMMTYVFPPAKAKPAAVGEEKGFVKGVVTYMVMDDLTVEPLSTISSISLLNKFNIGDFGVLEERVVHLGIDEVLKLLKASLDSKTVLTRVFLMA